MATTYTDPVTHKVYTLDPSGTGWVETGYELPTGTEPPTPVRQPQAHKIYIGGSSPNDQLALAMTSANSVQIENETYNDNLYARYTDAYLAWSSGQGSKDEPTVIEYYWDSDYNNLLAQTARGEDTTAKRPEEPSYNQ